MHLDAVVVKPQHVVKRVFKESETDHYKAKTKEETHQSDSINVRSGQINSSVHSEKKECSGELWNSKSPRPTQKTTVGDDHRILSMVKKPFHNIHPREEHCRKAVYQYLSLP